MKPWIDKGILLLPQAVVLNTGNATITFLLRSPCKHEEKSTLSISRVIKSHRPKAVF